MHLYQFIFTESPGGIFLTQYHQTDALLYYSMFTEFNLQNVVQFMITVEDIQGATLIQFCLKPYSYKVNLLTKWV